MSKRNRVSKTCLVCGEPFEVKAYRQKTAKWCSKACWAKRNPPDLKTCPICGQQYSTQQRQQVFCSRSCAGKARTGARANAWKNGESLRRPRAKAARLLTAWRESVYERDTYICQRCSATGRIHAHHIRPWAAHPEFRFDVANGLTLCISCHGKEHGKDFGNRHTKTCPVCSQTTQGRGKDGLCRSCAISLWHLNRGSHLNRPPNEVLALILLASQE